MSASAAPSCWGRGSRRRADQHLPEPDPGGRDDDLQDSKAVDGSVAFRDGGPFEAVVNLNYPDDYVSLDSGFAFTFTHVRVGDFVGAPPNVSDGHFKDKFNAEGSFSGQGGN